MENHEKAWKSMEMHGKARLVLLWGCCGAAARLPRVLLGTPADSLGAPGCSWTLQLLLLDNWSCNGSERCNCCFQRHRTLLQRFRTL